MRKINLLFADRLKSRLMQNADVFEAFKFIVHPIMEATVVDEWGESHLNALVKRCEDSPLMLVAAFAGFGGEVYYRNPTVRVISNGSGWTTLDKVLGKDGEA